MKYCRNLTFYEKPDYEYLRNIFYKLLIRKKYKKDNMYDWNYKAKKIIN